MIEYTLYVPVERLAQGGIAALTHRATLSCGGCTRARTEGTWVAPDGTVHHEEVLLFTYLVEYDNPLTAAALRDVVAELHALGEHTVLVRRMSGRGLVHFFIKEGDEVAL